MCKSRGVACFANCLFSHFLVSAVLVSTLLERGFVQAALDSTAPRLVSIVAKETSADIRRLPKWLSCTPGTCGAGLACADRNCYATAYILVQVQDFPVSDASSGQQNAGIKSVSVRFASPTATKQNKQAAYALEENIDTTIFSVARLDFPPGMGIGGGAEGTALQMPVTFDGYAESGEWRLDSVALVDHSNNVNILDRQSLDQFAFSISVSSLELATCSGSCGSAEVTCRQFGSPSEVTSRTPRHRVWWSCSSSGPGARDQGICCATCPQKVASSAGIEATCQAPSESLQLVPCGCAVSGGGLGWKCSSTYPSSTLGPASRCGGLPEASCTQDNATHTAKSCAAKGLQQLVYIPAAPPLVSAAGAGVDTTGGSGDAGVGVNVGGINSSGDNSSSARVNHVGGVNSGMGGGRGGEGGGEDSGWIREDDSSEILVAMGCVVGLAGVAVLAFFAGRLRKRCKAPGTQVCRHACTYPQKSPIDAHKYPSYPQKMAACARHAKHRALMCVDIPSHIRKRALQTRINALHIRKRMSLAQEMHSGGLSGVSMCSIDLCASCADM